MATTIQYWENGKIYTNNGEFLGEHSLDISRYELQEEDQGKYAEFTELEYACGFGDVVCVPGEAMEVLRYSWDGDHKQIFCRGIHDPAKEGWSDSSGNPEEGVEKGEYYIDDAYDHWYNAAAYWQANQDVLTPYTPDDFTIDEEGRILSRYN